MRDAGQRRMVEPRLATGSLGVGRRAGNPEYGQRVRALLYHEAGRHRDRVGAEPTDRRGTRRDADPGESPRNPWVRGAVAFAAIGPPPPLFATGTIYKATLRIRCSRPSEIPSLTTRR